MRISPDENEQGQGQQPGDGKPAEAPADGQDKAE